MQAAERACFYPTLPHPVPGVAAPPCSACSLADNEISSLEGLEGCKALEELSLEANRVSSLVGLGGLTRLRKLGLGQNRLASLEVRGGAVG